MDGIHLSDRQLAYLRSRFHLERSSFLRKKDQDPPKRKSRNAQWVVLDRMLFQWTPEGVEQDLLRRSLKVTFANGLAWSLQEAEPFLLSDVTEILLRRSTTDLIKVRLITKSGLIYTGYATPVITGGTNSTTNTMELGPRITQSTFPLSIISHITDLTRSTELSSSNPKSGGQLLSSTGR